VKAAAKNPRLVTSEYSGGVADRIGHSVTIQGAIRSAVVKIAVGLHEEVKIFDGRFGKKSLAVEIHTMRKVKGLTQGGISIVWAKAPRWEVA
jgi:hypothetical protein